MAVSMSKHGLILEIWWGMKCTTYCSIISPNEIIDMVGSTMGSVSFSLSIGMSRSLSACSIHLSNAFLEYVKIGRMAMFMARTMHIS